MSNDDALKSIVEMRQFFAECTAGIEGYLAGNPSTARLTSALKQAFEQGESACGIAQEALETSQRREEALAERSTELDYREADLQKAAQTQALDAVGRTAACAAHWKKVSEVTGELTQLHEEARQNMAAVAAKIAELQELQRGEEKGVRAGSTRIAEIGKVTELAKLQEEGRAQTKRLSVAHNTGAATRATPKRGWSGDCGGAPDATRRRNTLTSASTVEVIRADFLEGKKAIGGIMDAADIICTPESGVHYSEILASMIRSGILYEDLSRQWGNIIEQRLQQWYRLDAWLYEEDNDDDDGFDDNDVLLRTSRLYDGKCTWHSAEDDCLVLRRDKPEEGYGRMAVVCARKSKIGVSR